MGTIPTPTTPTVKLKNYPSISRFRIKVMVVRDESIPSDMTVTIQSPEDIYRCVVAETDVIRLDREAVYGLYLDTRNRLLGVELISLGTLNSTIVNPREVFKSAILLGSASIVLVHNHCSGDVTPSVEDMELTQRIYKSGVLLSIELLDHVIVSDGKHYSLKQNHPKLFQGGYRNIHSNVR